MLERTTVTFAREGDLVTARVDGPRLPLPPTRQAQGWVPQVMAALASRGLVGNLERGSSDMFIRAPLADGRELMISEPQEPFEEQPPGAWQAMSVRENDNSCQMWWDSATTGPDHAHLGIEPMLAAVDRRLDDLGVVERSDPRPVLNEAGTQPILFRAGFVLVEPPTGRFHRLPLAMTDPDEQRRAVTRAAGDLRWEGFEVQCPPELETEDPRAFDKTSAQHFGVDHLAEFISDQARHTRDVVAALDEVASPLDGMLAQSVATLHAAADWWQDLGGPGSERWVFRLQLMATEIERHTKEVRALRGELADCHTAKQPHSRAATVPPGSDPPRAQASRTTSPSAQHIPPASTASSAANGAATQSPDRTEAVSSSTSGVAPSPPASPNQGPRARR